MLYIATDHAGFELKEEIKKFLEQQGIQFQDFGAYEYNPDDDYPDFISRVGEAVSKDPTSRGIVLGGSGQAEMMVANKYPNVRAALFNSPIIPKHAADATGRESDDPFELIRLTREHNDSNILSLGARFLSIDDAINAVKLWLETPFLNDSRHVRRIEKIKQIEETLYK